MVEPFTFIHLSDPHIGVEGHDERLRQALADVDTNFPEAELIVISGDLTEFGRVDEFTTFTDIIKTSKRPVYNATGNHDVRWSESGKENYRKFVGDTYIRVDHKGMHFFLLDVTVLLEHYGHFDGQQLAKLEADLKSLPPGEPGVCVMHHPPLSAGHYIDNEFQFADLIGAYNVPLICDGHGHGFMRYSFNGIEFCMGGSTSNSGAPPRSYRVYHVTPETITPITRIFDRNKTTTEPVIATQKPALPKIGFSNVAGILPGRKQVIASMGDQPLTRPVTLIVDHVSSPGMQLKNGEVPLDLVKNPGRHQVTVAAAADADTTICATMQFESVEMNLGKTMRRTADPVGPRGITRRFALKSGCQSNPAVDGDVLYAGANDGILRAINLASDKGDVLWEKNLNREILSAPALTSQTVIVASMDSHIYCLDKATGNEVWKVKTGQAVSASPLVTTETVYIGSGDFNMYALDVLTGREKWRFAATRLIKATPALAEGKLFFGAWDNFFYCLDAATGALVWKVPVSNRANGHFSAATSNPVISGENIIFCSHDYTVRCISQQTGGTVWTYKPTKEELGPSYSTAVIKGGVAYFGSINGHVVGFDVERGTKVFDLDIRPSKKDDIFDSLPLLQGNKLYFGTVNGNLYCVDLEKKAVDWSVALQPSFIFTRPAAWKDRVLVGSMGDTIFEVKVR
ncbi:MAG: PQQ-binding-like beta-propeller repeat protein [Candidatus Sumerlaeaceae bacterium]